MEHAVPARPYQVPTAAFEDGYDDMDSALLCSAGQGGTGNATLAFGRDEKI